jgi:HlyD family secretion protein
MRQRLKFVIPALILVAALVTWLVLRNGSGSAGALFASGTVEGTEADLGFQVPGRVAEVGPHEGDAVSAGEQVAVLDTAELGAAHAAAEAQLAAAQARLAELERGSRPEEVAQARAGVRSATQRADEARRDAERAARLYQGGAISQQARDRATTAKDVSEAALDQAQQALALVRAGPRTEVIRAQRAMVEQARANLERARAALDNAVIHAPFAGVVTVRHREPGETVSPGAPVLTVLDPNDRWVRIYVREDEVGRVHLGEKATITSDTYPDRKYQGTVIFIGSQAEFTPRNVQTQKERIKLVYPVKVRITGDPGFDLKPGIPADVTLESPRS